MARRDRRGHHRRQRRTTGLVVDNPSQISGTMSPGLSFQLDSTYIRPANQPDFITAADLTGNGQLDFIVADGGANSVSRDPQSHERHSDRQHLQPGAAPTGVAVGDFTGDGNLDLAVATSNGVSILLGNGHGTFTPPVPLRRHRPGGHCRRSIYRQRNHGLGRSQQRLQQRLDSVRQRQGTFQTAVNITVGSDPVDIKAANLTGNSITDLVVANHGTGANTVSVLINNGSGASPRRSTPPASSPNSLAIADFTGNGILDIAVANVRLQPHANGEHQYGFDSLRAGNDRLRRSPSHQRPALAGRRLCGRAFGLHDCRRRPQRRTGLRISSSPTTVSRRTN